MKRLSISETWDDARTVLRADLALLLPVALATFGAAMALFMIVMPAPEMVEGQLPRFTPGPWMLWLIPCLILQVMGLLWISALVLRPGVSVSEAASAGLGRLPAALAVVLFLLVVQVALAIPVTLAIRMEGGAGPVASFLNFVSAAITFWVLARLTTVVPMLVDRGCGAMEAIRATFSTTAGLAGRMLLFTLIAVVAGLVVIFITTFLAGTVLGLIARLTGAVGITGAIGLVIGSGVVAIVGMLWAVMVACLHRRLQGSNRGM